MIEMPRSSFHISWRFFLAGVLLCLIQVNLLEALKGSAVVLQAKIKAEQKDELQVEGLGTGENITLPDGTVIPVNVTSATSVKSRLTGNPQIDYVYDPNLPRELNGYNLTEYPFYNGVPDDIDFKCDGLHDGFYASVPHKCQVYHHCLFGTRYDFLCANYTAFDQKTFICHFVSEVDCDNSPKYFKRNEALYKTATTTTPKPPPPPTTTTTTEAPPPSGGGGGRRPDRRRRPPYRRRRPVYEYYYDDEEEPQDSEYYEDEQPYVRRKPASSGRAHRNGGHKKNRNHDDDYETDHAGTEVVKPSVRTSDSPSVYERPRIPPKIRRPVPKNERDKYDYSPKKTAETSTTAPSKETKKKPTTEPEYYDDEYYDDVKPKHRPRPRHRPGKKRVEPVYDEYEEEPAPKPKKKEQPVEEPRGTRVSKPRHEPTEKPHRNNQRKQPKEEEKPTRKPEPKVEQKPAYEDEEEYYYDDEYEDETPPKKDKPVDNGKNRPDESKVKKDEVRFRPIENKSFDRPTQKPVERSRNSGGKQGRGQEEYSDTRDQNRKEQDHQYPRDQKLDYDTRHEEEAEYDNRNYKPESRPKPTNREPDYRQEQLPDYGVGREETDRNLENQRKGSRGQSTAGNGDRNRNREPNYEDSRNVQEETPASKFKPTPNYRSKGERQEETPKTSTQPEEYIEYEDESEVKEKQRPAENVRPSVPSYAKSTTSTRKYSYYEKTTPAEPSSTTVSYRQGQFESEPEIPQAIPFHKPQYISGNFRSYYQPPSKAETSHNTESREPPQPKEKPQKPSSSRDATLPPTNSELLHRKPTAQPVDPLSVRKQNKFLPPPELGDYQAPFLETSLDYKGRGNPVLVRPSAPEGFSLRNKQATIANEQERPQNQEQVSIGGLKSLGLPQPFSHSNSNRDSGYSTHADKSNARLPYRPKYTVAPSAPTSPGTSASSASGPSGSDQSSFNSKKNAQQIENQSEDSSKTLTLTGPGSTYLENTGPETKIRYPKLPLSTGLGISYQRPDSNRNSKPSYSPTGPGQKSKLSSYPGSIIPPAFIKQLDVTAPGASGSGRQTAQTSTIRNNGIQENDQLDYEEYDVTLNDALQPSTLHPTRSLALSSSFAQDPLLSPSTKGRRTISPPRKSGNQDAYVISDATQQFYNVQRNLGFRGSIIPQTETRPKQTYREQTQAESEHLTSRRKPKQPETSRAVLQTEEAHSRPTASDTESTQGVWVIQQTPRRVVNKQAVIAYDDFY